MEVKQIGYHKVTGCKVSRCFTECQHRPFKSEKCQKCEHAIKTVMYEQECEEEVYDQYGFFVGYADGV